jgi:hypothetical protein
MKSISTWGLVHLIPRWSRLIWISAQSWMSSPASCFFQPSKIVVFGYSLRVILAQLIPSISTNLIWKLFIAIWPVEKIPRREDASYERRRGRRQRAWLRSRASIQAQERGLKWIGWQLWINQILVWIRSKVGFNPLKTNEAWGVWVN